MLSCTLTCSEDYYKDGTNCMPCDASCAGCTGPLITDCRKCNSNYYMNKYA